MTDFTKTSVSSCVRLRFIAAFNVISVISRLGDTTNELHESCSLRGIRTRTSRVKGQRFTTGPPRRPYCWMTIGWTKEFSIDCEWQMTTFGISCTSHAKIKPFDLPSAFSDSHYSPIHLHPYYKNLGFSVGDFPEAELHAKNSITIPLYIGLTPKDQDRVAKSLKSLLWKSLYFLLILSRLLKHLLLIMIDSI